MSATCAVVVVGGGVNGLVCATLLAQGRRAPARPRGAAPRSAAARATRELAPGFSRPSLAHASGRCARTSSRELRAGRARPRVRGQRRPWLTALDDDGAAPLVVYEDAGAHRHAPARVVAGRRRALAGVHAPRSPASVASSPRCSTPRRRRSTRLRGRELWRAAAHARARFERWDAHEAIGCCAGGPWRWPISWPSRSRRRLRGGARRRRRLRQHARPVVGRQRPAVPAARRQRRGWRRRDTWFAAAGRARLPVRWRRALRKRAARSAPGRACARVWSQDERATRRACSTTAAEIAARAPSSRRSTRRARSALCDPMALPPEFRWRAAQLPRAARWPR